MRQIPSKTNPILRQTNNGNFFGDLWSSLNLDLVLNYGRILITKMIQTTNSTTNADLGCPVAFKYFTLIGGTPVWYSVAGAKVHIAGQVEQAFEVDSVGGTPITCSSDTSDMEIFNSHLYVTTQTTPYKLDSGGGGWSYFSLDSLTTATPHLVCVHGDRLYITDSYSKIFSIDTSDTLVTTGAFTLSLGDSYKNCITFIKSGSNQIWIGTLNTRGGKGSIYEWDGAQTSTSRSYRLETMGALSCVIKDDVPYVMDNVGRLLVWTGGTFKEIARLPITKGVLLKNSMLSRVNDRFIHPNGMTIVDGKINILVNNVNGDNTGTIEENFPSGVWEYDENVGLYHKHSLSYTPTGTTTITDYGQNRVFRVGALVDAKVSNTLTGQNGDMLAGATIYTDVSTTQSGVFVNDTKDTTQKYGYFVTQWIDSEGVKDTWQKIFLQYRKFLNSADKIICKYRTTEAVATSFSITWVDTSSFTTTTNVLGKEGQEVEILQGTGGGKCAHITTIDSSAGTYTVHLDDTFTGVTTATGKARVQAWIKMGEVTGQLREEWEMPIGKEAIRIQLKVCAQFTGKDELHRVILLNKVNQPAV